MLLKNQLSYIVNTYGTMIIDLIARVILAIA